jgi:hypothetical protein
MVIDALQINEGHIFEARTEDGGDGVTHTYIAREVKRIGQHSGVNVVAWCLTEGDEPTRVGLQLMHGTKVMHLATVRQNN